MRKHRIEKKMNDDTRMEVETLSNELESKIRKKIVIS